MPKKKNYTADEEAQVIAFIRQYGRKPAQVKFGLTRGQIAGLDYRDKRDRMARAAAEAAKLYPATPDIEPPLELEGDWLVCGDVQLPTTDYFFASLVARIAKRHLPNCEGLVIVGDFLNADAFSLYSPLQAIPSWQDELTAARTLITEWLKTFKRIVWLQGNHEHRFFKALSGVMAARDLLALITTDSRVTISIRDYCTVDTDNGRWTLVHGANYSRNQLWNPNRLALKFQTHVLAHHEHHLAWGLDDFKRYNVIANGGLFDVKKMSYVQLRTSTIPNMSKGFTMLKGGFGYVFGEPHVTDYDYWLPSKATRRETAAR